MIIKKLAVPLINEKILQQAVHCYIATSSLSEEGFDFVRTRIPAKTKIDIVTGLDELTSPEVLERVLSNYQGRINIHIYSRNTFHANVYVFDLPFRKSVAFVGSGTFSLEGFKDREELFWKITDPKEVESIMSWYTSYFQFGVPLTMEVVKQYNELHHHWLRRQVLFEREKQQFEAIVLGSFDLQRVKFRNQFFTLEHFTSFALENVFSDNASLRLQRLEVEKRMLELNDLLTPGLQRLHLEKLDESKLLSVEPRDHAGERIMLMGLEYSDKGNRSQFRYQVSLDSLGVVISLKISAPDPTGFRKSLLSQGDNEAFRTTLHKQLSAFKDSSVEVLGVRKKVDQFTSPSALMEFLQRDHKGRADLIFMKMFAPGEASLSVDKIAETVLTTLKELQGLKDILTAKV